MWTLYPDGSVRRTADGVTLIPDPTSDLPAQRDYQAWLAAGNVPAPLSAVAAPTPIVTGRQLVAQVKAAGIGSAVLAFLASSRAIQAMPTSIAYWNAVALDTRVPVDNAKLVNILSGAGVTDVPSFMAAALLLPA